MIGWVIVACEVGFWVFLLAGLFARYVLTLKKWGAGLILCTPVIDLVLILTTALDIHNGAVVTYFHGLAALYLGITIAYGHSMIKWMDARFSYRFAGGPKPKKPAKAGKEHAKLERAGWFRHLLAFCIGNVILGGMILFVGNLAATEPLSTINKIWTIVLVIDFAISFSYSIWPRKVLIPQKGKGLN